MINIQGLHKHYESAGKKILALNDINIDIAAGEIYGVIGQSGAGKSTLIRCVNGLESVSSGNILIDNNNITQLDAKGLRQARSHIGMIFQHFNLLSSRTVYANVAFPLELSGFSKKEINQKIMPLIELTGLSDKLNHYPSQLSGGQKQRVAIARALANQPKVLLCDEATSALDLQTTHSILQLLKDINKQFNLTIMLITHEMDVVKEICHRLAIIENGSIIEEADVMAFFSDPQTDIAKAFIRHTFKHHLPASLQSRVLPDAKPGCRPLLRLSFIGSAAEEPLISHLSQDFDVHLSILQANIEQIRDETIGVVVVEASGGKNIEQGIAYLRQKGINVEEIGYVERDHTITA